MPTIVVPISTITKYLRKLWDGLGILKQIQMVLKQHFNVIMIYNYYPKWKHYRVLSSGRLVKTGN
jgi:hypothetical protein